jgi:hypothetical protein
MYAKGEERGRILKKRNRDNHRFPETRTEDLFVEIRDIVNGTDNLPSYRTPARDGH